jgi:NADPH:quinone reductase-like Zn-dependent oxidoreductase
MKAITQDTYGSADVLELADIERPAAGDGEVLVQVRAAGVDRGVWHLMTGLPYLVRIMGYGFRRPKTRVPGMDVAGRVEAVGAKVTRFKPGDEVYGIGVGTFAEYACAREDKLAIKPANLTFTEAAAVPVSGLTALKAVREEAKVKPGQRVLILGASGGVGTFAVQIAKAFGAEVTGVCSTAKMDLVRSLGAEHVIDYSSTDATRGDERYDVVFDLAGNRPLSHLRRTLTPRGTLVIIGGEEGGRWFGGIGRQIRAALLSPLVRQRLRMQLPTERLEELLALTELVQADKVKPVIDRTFPLEKAPDAIRHMQEGHARGKVVVTPSR